LGYFYSKLIEKITFSQKGNSKKVGKDVFKIINYCFGKSAIFVFSNNTELIKGFLENIAFKGL
jgi:hypothetical protein